MQNEKSEYNGFPLFFDIEDVELRRRNQAVILVNILEDHFKDGKISKKGAGLHVGYFNEIPREDRNELLKEFVRQANERGFKIG